ncbi:MAG TPA: PIN domain nuclease [Acetobacteraceae bacterium]|nr:PIN domain nuclease [Acetobacteraceae bacterium]
MIVVDSSVWIANLRNTVSEPVRVLRSLFETEVLLVGDIVLLEVLQGARDEAHAIRLARDLNAFDIVPMLGTRVAVQAARNYRILRSKGITIRKTIDLIIGTFCIERDHTLLHDDRDFEPMRLHLGLQVL